MPSKKTTARKGTRASSKSKGATGRRQQAEPRNTGREAGGVIVICLGLLSCYFALTTDATGFAGAIRAIMLGLAGKLCFLLPLLICWGGLLLAFSARKKTTDHGRVLLIAGLFLLAFGFVELFSMEEIGTQVRLNTYGSYLVQGFRFQGGAGLLGMLTAWPLYEGLRLRVWGSGIVYVALAVVDLILMHTISLARIRDRARDGFAEVQQRAEERREERAERREARAERAAAERLARENQLKIPRAEEDAPGRPFRRNPSATSKAETVPAFESGQTTAAPSRSKPARSAVPEPTYFTTSAAEAEPAEARPDPVYDILREHSRSRKAQPEKPKQEPEQECSPEDVPPFPLNDTEEEDFFGGTVAPPFPEAFKGRDSAKKTEVVSSAQEETEEAAEDEPAPRPGASLIEEARPPRKEPAQPLPSFVADDVPYVGIHNPADQPAPAQGDAQQAAPSAAPVQPSGSPQLPFRGPAANANAAKTAGASSAESVPEREPYNYPPIDLLERSAPAVTENLEQSDRAKGQKLVDVLHSFGVSAQLTGIQHGPTVTRFELVPAAGTRVNRITNLVDDIALGLAARSIRIEAPIPGKSAVGVEIPNDKAEIVPLRDVLESADAQRHPSRVAAALGRDNAGRNILCDLSKMPHMLVAGQTGSGKSVCINCIICSILYRAAPEEVRLILIDPKFVELAPYNNVPHLLVPVVVDPKKAAGALEWATREMDQRYQKFAALGVRDIKGYNQHRPEGGEPMPQIVIIVDELADLIMTAKGDIESPIMRLGQKARAAGMYMVLATQRPSVDVITGVIKANIPSRIAFTVASQTDSRTILDLGGAEKLLGKGDMLYFPTGTASPQRVQGAYVSDEEVKSVVDYILARHSADYNEDLAEHLEKADMSDAEREEADDEYDALLPQAVEAVLDARQASISMLQRRLRIGYARAGRLIDEMTRRGIISEADGAKPRDVLITREQFLAQYREP